MNLSLEDHQVGHILEIVAESERTYRRLRPGFSTKRQPVHTVYGSAELFDRGVQEKLGAVALEHFQSFVSDFVELSLALGMPGSKELPQDTARRQALQKAVVRNVDRLKETHEPGWLAAEVYRRLIEKLRTGPVEDYRIDFEDGFGIRSDEEEDHEARRTAQEVVRAHEEGKLPPFCGIRIKPLDHRHARRSLRTFDIFLTTVLEENLGRLPDHFVVTLPKITSPQQVSALVQAASHFEQETSLNKGDIRLELMIETPAALIDTSGRIVINKLVEAAAGRCESVHLGAYDYTSLLEIAGPYQSLGHPACEFARQLLVLALAGTGIAVVDGPSQRIPAPIHHADDDRPLRRSHQEENREAVQSVWRDQFQSVFHALGCGIYQGWDLHPAHLVSRYAAVYAFYLNGLQDASKRMRALLEAEGKASRAGNVVDDASSGLGLVNFFRRGLNCGALTADEVESAGLSPEDLRAGTFDLIQPTYDENPHQGNGAPGPRLVKGPSLSVQD